MIDLQEKEREKEEALQKRNDFYKKMIWIAIPTFLGVGMTYFSNMHTEIQILAWVVIIAVAGFGVWATNAKTLRKRREVLEQARWDKLDARFDNIDARFDEVDARFNLSENTDKTLLRNELVKFHREWVEEAGYITLEALEYIDSVHDAYNAVNGNKTGDKLWKDLHALPMRENRKNNLNNK